jgi:hypothetical protein
VKGSTFQHGMNEHNQTRIQQAKHLFAKVLGFEELIAPYVDRVYTL